MTAPHSMIVNAASADTDPRPRLAALYGADFSALSITPARGDRAPGAVRAALPRFSTWNAALHIDLSEWHVADLGDAGAHRHAWPEAFDAIAQHVAAAMRISDFTIGIGGDHSVTYPIASSLAGRSRRLGIIQLDAHHDVRSPTPTPSNGSPIRGLIDAGHVRGEDVVQIGIHPCANARELAAYCDATGIIRFTGDDVRDRGASACMNDAIAQLAECDRVHLTVDIDVLDRAFAPGTVAALPGGITPGELMQLVEVACSSELVTSMDVVEFDPDRDVSLITAYNVANVVMTALATLARRRSGR